VGTQVHLARGLLGLRGCGELVGVVVPEVSAHRGGAAITDHVRLVAVHAARLSGDSVVGCLGEVASNRTYAPVLRGSEVTVRQDGQKLVTRDGREPTRSRTRL
jgi:hypothetical protein